MIDALQSIILDYQEMNLFTGVPRRLRVETLPGKAAVCMGVRRAGKSTYLFQIMDRLMKAGVSRKNILYLNFFDDRLHHLKQERPGRIADAYFSLFPEKKNAETVYFFFDEIQAVSGWEPFVDRLMRMEKCEVYLTGSSARMLSKEIATQMRGRALAWELFPFSFREFLDFKGVDHAGPLSARRRLRIINAFDAYWETGGFPEVAGVDPHLRIKIHQEYFQAVLFRDIVERYDISHPNAASDLAHRLIDNIAALHSVNRLTGYLKSLGRKAPKSAVSDFLNWFQDAYFLFAVRLFDASLARSNLNPKKIYCIDHAMVNSLSSGILINAGHLLENLVFSALRRISPDIFYYRTQNGMEVDFIVDFRTHTTRKGRLLVQACASIHDPKTRKREISALSAAMAEQGHDAGVIVTLRQEDVLETKHGKIHIVPAWRFLLDMDDDQGADRNFDFY